MSSGIREYQYPMQNNISENEKKTRRILLGHGKFLHEEVKIYSKEDLDHRK